MGLIENNSNNKTDWMSCPYKSNKIIKITQFNSGLVLKQRRTAAKISHNTHSVSPHKQFTLKIVKDFNGKSFVDSDNVVEQELRRREIQYRRSKQQEANSSQKQIRLFTTTKWNYHNQLFNINMLANQMADHSVVIVRPLQIEGKKGQGQQIAGFNKNKVTSRTSSCRDRVKEKQYTNFSSRDEGNSKRMSVTPRKRYFQLFQQQKRFQENLEKEKRQLLEIRQQLKKNYAKPFNPPENVSAYAYIVFEADCERRKKLKRCSARRVDQEGLTRLYHHSHKVLVSLNSRTALEMASLTKIMTCIVAIQLAKNYSLDLEREEVTVGSFEANTGGTSANIKQGQIYSVLQLLYGMMLPSGNDASLSIAVWGGKVLLKKQRQIDEGNKWKKRECYDRFLAQMNAKASQLNMQKTKYSNSHGLSNAQNKSCCFELGILCQYAMNNPLFRKIVSSRQYSAQIKVEGQSIQNGRGSIRDNKKWIKKRMSLQSNDKMQLQELKDLDDVQQSSPCEEEEDEEVPVKQLCSKTVKWQNTHQLLQNKPDLYIGIKTGVTTTAGPCLASCVEVHNRRFMIVVLNCKSMKNRMKDTEILRRWIFQKEGIKRDEKDGVIMSEMITA